MDGRSLFHCIFSLLEAVGVLWLLVPFLHLQNQRQDISDHFSIVTCPCMVTHSRDLRIETQPLLGKGFFFFFASYTHIVKKYILILCWESLF